MEQHDNADTRPQRFLGRYALLQEAGRGGMSTVYEAQDTQIGRRVAIKVVNVSPHLPAAQRDALVSRLRRKLGDTSDDSRLILTAPGFGYRLAQAPQQA